MPVIHELDSETFIKLITSSSRYLIEDKFILTPVMPLESGFNLYLYTRCNFPGDFDLTIAMIIRWAILYELFSIMEIKDRQNLDVHIKTSIYFVSEWLDDLMLHNWVTGYSAGELIDWERNPIPQFPYVLSFCKHCFTEISKPFPIDSLHYHRKHTMDCARKYNNDLLKETVKASYKAQQDLWKLRDEIERSNSVRRRVSFSTIRNRLQASRYELIFIANKWYDRLVDNPHYNNHDFKAMVKIENRDDFYCPENRIKRYSELKNVLDNEYPDMATVFSKINKSNFVEPLITANLIRRFLYTTL